MPGDVPGDMPGAPVGEAGEDYRAWASSWARVRRRAQVRLLVAVLCAVAAGALVVTCLPTWSEGARRRAVDRAVDDVAECCHAAHHEMPGSCRERLPSAAADLDDDLAPGIAASVADVLRPLVPAAVPPDDGAALRRQLWSLCPELAVVHEGAPPFTDDRKNPVLARALADAEPVVSHGAAELLR